MGCSHGSRGRTNQRLRTRSLSVPFALSLNPRRLPPTHSVSRASAVRVCRADASGRRSRRPRRRPRAVRASSRRGCVHALPDADAMTSRPGRAQTACSLARGPRPACWEARLPATLTGCVDASCPPRARSRERPTRANGNAATCKGWVRCTGLEPTRRNGRSLSRSRRHRYISSHSPSLPLCSPPPSPSLFSLSPSFYPPPLTKKGSDRM